MDFLVTFQEAVATLYWPMDLTVQKRAHDWSVFNFQALGSDATLAFERILDTCRNEQGILTGTLLVTGADHVAFRKLVQLITTPTSPTVTPLALQVRVDGPIFKRENYDAFLNLFNECGPVMTKLELCIPSTGVTLPGSFPGLQFPVLRALRLHWKDAPEGDVPPEEGTDSPGNRAALLQSLLQAAPALKELWVRKVGSVEHFPVFQLPPTLTFLSLHGIANGEVAILTHNILECLETLELYFEGRVPSAELLLQVFHNVHASLRSLTLDGSGIPASERRLDFQFPWLRALEHLQSNFTWINPPDRLVDYLPELTTLTLNNQDGKELQELINWESPPMHKVTKLKLRFYGRGISGRDGGPLTLGEYQDLPIPRFLVWAFRRMFPNLTMLHFATKVTVGYNDLCIRTLLGKAPKLQKLVIDALNNDEENAPTWSILLSGGRFVNGVAVPITNATRRPKKELRYLQINWTRPMSDSSRIGDSLTRQLGRSLLVKVILETGRTVGEEWEAWVVDGNATYASELAEKYRKRRESLWKGSNGNAGQFEMTQMSLHYP